MSSDNIYLSNTTTSITNINDTCKILVQYGFDVVNTLLAYIDDSGTIVTGDGFIIFRDEKLDFNLNIDGELIVTSFTNSECNHYSIDSDGNLIYTY